MKKLTALLFLLNIPLIAYLLTPFPNIPDLGNELKSDLPGDTIQVPNIKGFFTNWPRARVIDYYKTNLPKPYIRINHPPERAKVVVRDEIQSYYLEEFVFPLKGSVYINGFEWKNDVFTKPEKRIVNEILVGTTSFDSKVTVRWYPASTFYSLLNLFGLNSCISFFIYIIRKKFNSA